MALVMLLVPVVSHTVLRSSRVQSFLISELTSYLSAELNTEVYVGGVDVTLFLNIVIERIYVKDLHDKPLLKSDKLILNIKGFKGLSLRDQILRLRKITFDKSNIHLERNSEDSLMNFQFLVDYFSPPDTLERKKEPWTITCSALEIKASAFKYRDGLKINTIIDGSINFNDLNISDLNLKIKNIKYELDTVSGSIKNISLSEKSGFTLNHLSAGFLINPVQLKLTDLKITTPESDILLDIAFGYGNFSAFNDFVHEVKMTASIYPSDIQLGDIGFFVPDLSGINNLFKFGGEFKGRISNFKLKEINLEYADNTFLKGNLSMNGLPDFKETFIHLSIKDFKTSKHDIESVMIPCKEGIPENIILPDELLQLGQVKIKGSFTGFYNSFVSYANFYTNLGMVSTDISLVNTLENGEIEYEGEITADNFQLGNLLSLKNTIGTLDFSASIKGSGLTDKTASFDLNCSVDSIYLRDYCYQLIKISGKYDNRKFSGKINLDDPNCTMNFDGIIDYSSAIPQFDFNIDILNARLHRLNLIDTAIVSNLSTHMEFEFKGNNIDNISGSVQAENTTYTQDNNKFILNDLLLIVSQRENGNKSLRMRSDYIDADITGVYSLLDLGNSVNHYFKKYMPSYITDKEEKILPQDFNYHLYLKNTHALTSLFIPELSIADNSVISGNFNTENEKLLLSCKSSLVSYGSNNIYNWRFEGKSSDNQFLISSESERLSFSDSLGMDGLTLKGILDNDSLRYHILWNNKDIQINKGKIIGYFDFFDKKMIKHWIEQSEIYYEDSLWRINKDNYMVVDTNGILFHNIVISNKNQSFEINGNYGSAMKEMLHIGFTNFNLSNLDIFTSIYQIDLDGIINGSIDLLDISQAPNFQTDIKVQGLYFNKNKLGDAEIQSSWDAKKNGIYSLVDVIYTGNIGQIKPIRIEGYYYPSRENDNFDMEIELTNLNLQTIYPYIDNLVSEIIGYADGKLHLSGSQKQPELNGFIKLRTKRLIVDYLNTEYTFSDTVHFKNDKILFNNFQIGDQTFHNAYVNGQIDLNYFRDINLNLKISMDHFRCLNTNRAQNELFYGKASGSGLVNISGRLDDIKMDINARTEKGTELVIPLNSGTMVTEGGFITFISKDTIDAQVSEQAGMTGLTLKFDLEVTPDASVLILLDPEGEIKARGNANLQMEINTLGDFTMFGDYIVEEGTYLFTLQNLINKRFTIQKGGRIKWNGDPFDAIINMNALYRTKAPLGDIQIFALDSSASYKRRVPVECILGLSGPLFSPEISFNIELPNSDEDTRQLFYSAIDTTNELQMNKQILSLLVLSRFTSDQRGFSISESVGSTSYELLSNQLSGWLSQISNDFDIGVNYRPGDELTNDELEVALSTQLFNDRLLIDGNFGVGGDQNNPNSQSTSNIVGDVNIEVKITDDGRFRVKAFNRANTTYLHEEYAPYTQGIGVFYRREFDRFSELFNKQRVIK